MKLLFSLLSLLIIDASSNELRKGNLMKFKGQLRNIINTNFIKTLVQEQGSDPIQDNIMVDLNVDLSIERPKLVRPLIGTPMKSYECHAEDNNGWPVVVLKDELHCELCYSIAYRDGIQDLLAYKLQMQLTTKGSAALNADEIFEFEEQFMMDAKRFTDETFNNIKPCKGIRQSIESIYNHLRNTFETIVKDAASKI